MPLYFIANAHVSCLHSAGAAICNSGIAMELLCINGVL